MEMKERAASSERSGRAAVWAGTLGVGIVLALLAQFTLDSLADQNQTWHWAQHAMLFWAGLMAGAGILGLYRAGSA